MEDAPAARARLVSGQAAIDDAGVAHELKLRGFGDEDGGRLLLQNFEALYLLYTGRLQLREGRRQVGFGQFLERCQAGDPDTLSRFLIYRDLRNRGYVAKDGFGFGSDFRVYERGHFGTKGAKFLVFGFNEGQHERMSAMQKKVDEITGMGKEPIIAVIERRGEVIYYKINKMAFGRNKLVSHDPL